jgi:hypothetical protein
MPVVAGSKIRAGDFSLTTGQKLRAKDTTSGQVGKPLKASQK